MKRVQLSAEELAKSDLRAGDLLFARRSLTAEGAGKCSVVCEIKEPTTFESSIIRARPDSRVADSLFLYYMFSSPYGAYVLGTIRRQVAVAGITGTDLVELPIPLPPLAQQKTISQILGALDDKIELNQKMNATLEAISQATFKSTFIDPAITNLPLGWRESTIGEEVRVVGGSTPSTTRPEFWEGGVHHWATPKDLSNLSSPVLLETERRITESGLQEIGSGLLHPERFCYRRVRPSAIWSFRKCRLR